MGGADIADQIRGSYRFDHWLRNFKWRHSIFWWGVQVLLVNSYKCYYKYYNIINETPMNHYKYQKMIAHVWMDKQYYSRVSRQKQDGEIISTMSTLSTNASSVSSRRSHISASYLNPFTVSSKSRINTSVAHWPSVPSQSEIKKCNCQLHWWVTGKSKYKNVAFCKECDVSLCTELCYELFHTCWYIFSQKERLKVDLSDSSKINDTDIGAT